LQLLASEHLDRSLYAFFGFGLDEGETPGSSRFSVKRDSHALDGHTSVDEEVAKVDLGDIV